MQRASVAIGGAVQGVGFQPFVYRLARELDLAGWVSNSPSGVLVEVEGRGEGMEAFLVRLEKENPPRASIQSLEPTFLDAVGHDGFEIRRSTGSGRKSAVILPDIATCADCLADLFDPGNRRYRYPFTNCAHCGPRYSIVEALPYDRPNTTMKGFSLCPECRAEYEDPLDRRFHAQPNACAACGPQIALWDANGRSLATRGEALHRGVAALRQGRILAVKGLGGFHLVVDARNEAAVARLRRFKSREGKPFALMYPDLRRVAAHCELSALEERLLRSPEAPIVLLRRNGRDDIALDAVPHNPFLGIMLPCTPLHHLLMRDLGEPIVATSGNLAEEPICTDERQALGRLRSIADRFLVHDRPIRRHVDDSIARVVAGRELVLRRARGYAPLPVRLDTAVPCVIGYGAHLKNTVALSVGREAFVSQHIGDLQGAEANAAFRRVIDDLPALYGCRPQLIACDAHPDYPSTRYAGRAARPVLPVQHHYAHVLSCMAENRLSPPLLGVAWDGTGYGLDGTVWGGEFLRICEDAFERAAHLRTFPLPGGDAAVREPRRSALGLLFELFGEEVFERPDLIGLCGLARPEASLLRSALVRGVNAPRTSSIGRLFDAVSAMLGLRRRRQFEGQAAMEAILGSADNWVQAFLAAGHVCMVMGYTEYEPIARTHSVPIVVTGFEPLDILQGVYMAVRQLEEGRAEVENQYARTVRRQGNPTALRLIREVFRIVPRKWRGVGEIAASGLGLRPPYADLDAATRFGVAVHYAEETGECISGLILQGRSKPTDCPAFGRRCVPEHPLGATMVSSEGACAAYYAHRRMGAAS